MAKVSQNVIATPEPTPNPNPNPDPIHTPVQPPQTASTSRLIVFLTGITTLIIAVCLTSFWIYETGTGNTVIDFSKLTALFISLGIGIIPYGINQVSNAGSSSGGD